jgi:hypothetical protein
MHYPVELPVHSEEVDTMSLAINQVNVFEGLEQAKRQRKVQAGDTQSIRLDRYMTLKLK